MQKRALPLLNELNVGRRPFVLGAVSTCVLAACGVSVQDGDGGEPLPDGGDGSANDGAAGGRDSAADAGGVDANGADATAMDARTVDSGAADTGSGRDAAPDAAPDAPTCSPGPTRLGNVSMFARGTWTVVAAARVIVGHDGGGLYAYSNVCTHAGCTVGAPSSTGVATCPCHLSRFDGNGAVVHGPATQPLPHYELTICASVAYVNRSRVVSASTRTPVP
jgi:Rieske Fe-S protein